MNRDEAWMLLNDYIKNPALVRHCLAVESAMVFYAKEFGEDPHDWSIAGLLHDFDYERWPEPPDHTRKGEPILREHGANDVVIGAILSHADWNQEEFPRDTPIRKTLFAVDELCGFIYAAALVRPERIVGMTAKSVRKKMKQASFAAAVNRDDIVSGAALINMELNDHIDNCIAAMSTIVDALELAPPQ